MNNSFDSHNSRVKKAHQKRAIHIILALKKRTKNAHLILLSF